MVVHPDELKAQDCGAGTQVYRRAPEQVPTKDVVLLVEPHDGRLMLAGQFGRNLAKLMIVSRSPTCRDAPSRR